MNIAFVASEMVPFSKTGGLADVAGALPAALATRGHDVIAISPRYGPVPGATPVGPPLFFGLFGVEHRVDLYSVERHGVRWILVDNPAFHRPGIYGDASGAYDDNLFRYALLSRAALEAGAGLLGDPVVFHANDWHTGLLPVYLQALYRSQGRLPGARVVLGLHNLGHQGTAPAGRFAGLGLPDDAWPVLDMHGALNPLKAGLVAADALVAVSPSYSRQIQIDQGFGLEGVLRARTDWLVGVLNGIDDAWDPATDPHLAANFTIDDLSGKAVCKAALQRELGLPQRADVPLVSLISRLDYQKGIDLVQAVVPWLLQHDVQLVMLGSGAPRYEAFFREAEARWPSKARGWVGFNDPLAHRIEAAADVFVMPSRFEPCGLNQMYSMRYGTVPVVHATGGLADTVTTVDPRHDRGTGWAFSPLSAEALQAALTHALGTYTEFPAAFRQIQRRGMSIDWSWARSAAAYEAIYARVLQR